MGKKKLCFQEMILALQAYWSKLGCVILQPYDLEMGAGTFHPATTLKSVGPKSWNTAYVQPCRRPTDGRYGENPNRVQHFYQFQVLMKPSPKNCQELYLQSLREIGIDPLRHDIRFVEDNWESPTLGAAGLGWEVWCDGQEITQFTYFQQMGGIECHPVSAELTYGLERVACVLQDVPTLFDLDWNGAEGDMKMTYADIFKANEQDFSAYNFEKATPAILFQHFSDAEQECLTLLDAGLPLAAYDQCMKASHYFNLLDARGLISVLERANYIGRVRTLAKGCCEGYLAREISQ